MKDMCFGEWWFTKVLQPLSDIINFVLTFLINGSSSMTNMLAKSQDKQWMAINWEERFVAYFTEDLFWSATTIKFQFLTPWKMQSQNSKNNSNEISIRQEFFRCYTRKVSHFNFFSRLRWNFVHKTNTNFFSSQFTML